MHDDHGRSGDGQEGDSCERVGTSGGCGQAGIESKQGKKGPGGGFYLARKPKEIRLKQVLDAVGESTAPLQCVAGRADKYCSQVSPCQMKGCWHELKKEIDRFFNGHTLHDVCSSKKR